jgi:hypothetical protein
MDSYLTSEVTILGRNFFELLIVAIYIQGSLKTSKELLNESGEQKSK